MQIKREESIRKIMKISTKIQLTRRGGRLLRMRQIMYSVMVSGS